MVVQMILREKFGNSIILQVEGRKRRVAHAFTACRPYRHQRVDENRDLKAEKAVCHDPSEVVSAAAHGLHNRTREDLHGCRWP